MSFRSLTSAARPLALAALSVAIVGALVAPGSAHASAFQLKENSAKGLGRAYAGSTTAGNDVSVVANNPAAMSDLDGTYVQADITAINFSAKFSGSAHDALGRPISGGNGGDAGTTLPVPALFFATKVSDRVNLGIAFDVPFGFQTEYDQNWMGRYDTVKTKLQSLDSTLSASFKINDQFSVGASAIAERTNADLTNAINFNAVGMGLVQQGVAAGAIPPQAAPGMLQQINGLLPPGSDGYAQVKGDNWAWGWQLGAYWKLTPNDRLALDYRAKISHTIVGTANFTSIPPAVGVLLANPAVAPLLANGVPFQHTTGTARLTNPATATLSYWHQAEKFGIGMDASWTQWSVMRQLTVNYANPGQPATTLPFNWRNTWYVSVGGDYYLSDKLTLRGGVAIDQAPMSATNRDPRVPDAARRMASIGLGYKANDHFEINASYAHIFVSHAGLDGATSATGDVLAGNFNDYGNLLSLSAQYKF